MSQTPPPLPPTTLNYSGPLPPAGGPGPRGLMRQFLLGLGVGVAISLLAWVAGWSTLDQTSYGWAMFYVVIGFKVIGGVTAACFRRYRLIGIGLIVSLPIGAMIFFTSCAAHFTSGSWH